MSGVDTIVDMTAGDSLADFVVDCKVADGVVGSSMATGMFVGSSMVAEDRFDCSGETESCWQGAPRLPLLPCLSCGRISLGWQRMILQFWHTNLKFFQY